MELKRKITKADNESDIKLSKTRLIFNDQKLLDLWNNVLSGQLSDGVWENSNGTEWLWKDASAQLGNENKIYVSPSYRKRRKTYSFFRELFKYVGDRMLIQNGFEDEKELKIACKTVQDMIKNYSEDKKIGEEVKIEKDRIKLKKENIIKTFIEKLNKNGYNFTKEYSFSEYKIKINNFEISILEVEDNIVKLLIYGKSFGYSKFKMYIKEENFDEVVKNIVKLASFNYRR